MAFEDLRQFIDRVDEIGELSRIDNVDWNLEIGAITEVAATSSSSPAVLFDNIKGYQPGFRIFANPVRKYTRAAIALGLPHNLPPVELMRMWKEKSGDSRKLSPARVDSGPVEENIDEGDRVNLWKFPTPLWHPKDGGRYLGTASLVINRDEETDWVNIGVYRVQIFDRNTVGLFIDSGHHGRLIAEKFWEKGKPCPIAICCGQDPTLWIAATFPLAAGKSEYDYAGTLRGEPVKVVEGKETGLPIPATAEIVLEGDFLPPEVESRVEGPFGEWTGYYGSGARECPVVRVRRVMHRDNPVMMGAPPIRGNQVGLPFVSVEIWKALESSGVPNVRGVWNHIGHSLFMVVSIKQAYAGHAKQAALAALGSNGGAYHGTFVIVVDEDIDPSNLDEVIWAVTTRCEPSESVDIVRNCWSGYLDPKIPLAKKDKRMITNSRAIINACRPYEMLKEFPEVSAIDKQTRWETVRKWGTKLGVTA